MALHDFKKQKIQIAEETPFDPDRAPECEFVATDVQGIIEEICSRIANSASPGFTFGDSGNVTAGAWLLNDTVPSNKAGRLIYINNAEIDSVFVSCETATTFNVDVYEHDSVTYTLLYTLAVVASRSASATDLGIALTTGKELAIQISGGSVKNPVVGAVLRGTL